MVVERWREVAGWPGYEVSDLGRVRSYRRYADGRMIRLHTNNAGYAHVKLCKLGVVTHKQVHALVCAAFNGPKPAHATLCAHNDGIRNNNTPNNLRWDTYAGNSNDMIRHKTRLYGDNHPRAQLTQLQVDSIKHEYTLFTRKKYVTRGARQQLAAKYGVTIHVIKDILGGRSWI